MAHQFILHKILIRVAPTTSIFLSSKWFKGCQSPHVYTLEIQNCFLITFLGFSCPCFSPYGADDCSGRQLAAMSINSQLCGHPTVILFPKHLSTGCQAQGVPLGQAIQRNQPSFSVFRREQDTWRVNAILCRVTHKRESGEFILPLIHQVFSPCLLSVRHCSQQHRPSSKGHKAAALLEPAFRCRQPADKPREIQYQAAQSNGVAEAALLWIFMKHHTEKTADTRRK